MDRAINYLGIARKAGLLEIGEENSGAAVRGGKAKLLLLASDASENARSRAKGFVMGRRTLIVELPYTKLDIAEHMGKSSCSMAALCDIGLANSLMTALREAYPEPYGKLAEEVARRYAKALQRKREARAHERNARMGKRRTKE